MTGPRFRNWQRYVAPYHRRWYDVGYHCGLWTGLGIGVWALLLYAVMTWR